mgnify:CR=1 FL=1
MSNKAANVIIMTCSILILIISILNWFGVKP